MSRSPILWMLAGLAIGIVFLGGAVAGALGFAALKEDGSDGAGSTPAAGQAAESKATVAAATASTSSPSTGATPSPSASALPATSATPARPTATAEVCDLARAAPFVQTATVQVRTSRSVGTAFHVGGGEFVTAAHVVEGETEVGLESQRVRAIATVVGLDFPSDIALLRADSQIAPLSWGDSSRVTTGQRLGVMGYPLGLSGAASYSTGAVSRVYSSNGTNLIQTDAAINPGNSGGAVFDECGRVVGVVSAKDVGGEGIGLAVAERSARPALARARTNPPKRVCSDRSSVVAAGAANQIALDFDWEQRLTGEFSVAQTDQRSQLGIKVALVTADGSPLQVTGMLSPSVQYSHGTIDVKVPQSARYLVIDNRFSLFTPKSVTLTLCVFR